MTLQEAKALLKRAQNGENLSAEERSMVSEAMKIVLGSTLKLEIP